MEQQSCAKKKEVWLVNSYPMQKFTERGELEAMSRKKEGIIAAKSSQLMR
jgi:hypothetical protein